MNSPPLSAPFTIPPCTVPLHLIQPCMGRFVSKVSDYFWDNARTDTYYYTVRKFNWWRYVTKFSTISLYLTKLYVTNSFAIASSVKYSEICQNFLTVCSSYGNCAVWPQQIIICQHQFVLETDSTTNSVSIQFTYMYVSKREDRIGRPGRSNFNFFRL